MSNERFIVQYETPCDYCDGTIDDDEAIELDDCTVMCSDCQRKRKITLHESGY